MVEFNSFKTVINNLIRGLRMFETSLISLVKLSDETADGG